MPKSKIETRVNQIRAHAARKRLTLQELSDLSNLPIPTIQNFMKEDSNPTLKTLIRVELALFGGN